MIYILAQFLFVIHTSIPKNAGNVQGQNNARVQTNDEYFSAAQMERKFDSNARERNYIGRSG